MQLRSKRICIKFWVPKRLRPGRFYVRGGHIEGVRYYWIGPLLISRQPKN